MDNTPDYVYGRAVTDYWVDHPSQELSVSLNDVVKLVRKEGRRQFVAINLVTGTEGLIPTYCITPLRLPEVAVTHETPVFFALNDFHGTEQGDLTFPKGAVIVGEYAVDSSWWYGRCESHYGIFPIEWVRRLLPSESIIKEQETISAPNYVKDVIELEFTPSADSSKQLQSGPYGPYGRALYDFKSGVPGELQFSAGDFISLLRYVDENWIEGELFDGRHGIFPQTYVEIVQPIENYTVPEIYSDSMVSEDQVENFPPDTYAIVLAEYIPASQEEPGFQVGDTVTVLNRRGYAWVEAMDDYGNVGFCPAGNLKIIGSEPDEAKLSSNTDDLSLHSGDSAERSVNSASPAFTTQSAHPNRTENRSGRSSALQTEIPQYPTERAEEETLNENWQTKRKKVVQEIIETERDYLESLKVCVAVLRQDPPPPPEFNMKLVISNIDAVLRTSESFLRDLRASDEQVGECFLRHLTSNLRAVYLTYCKDNAGIEALVKYKDIPHVSSYMSAKVADIRTQTNCFDLPSMFIKPLQRVLKYPLLMDKLLKETPDRRPDQIFVKDSLRILIDMAGTINELKRRKELVEKYRNPGSSGRLSNRLSRMSFHSVAKKSSRIGMKISSTFGFTTLMQDSAFQTEERRFQVSKRAVKHLSRNVEDFIEQVLCLVPLFSGISNNFVNLLGRKEGVAFSNCQCCIGKSIDENYVPKLRNHVVWPLQEVLKRCQGPDNLISKRHAKLIDYENWKRKVERTKADQRTQSVNDEVELAKKTYQALNAQLLEDLPKFNSVLARMMQSCIESFLHLRKVLFHMCANELSLFMASSERVEHPRSLSQKINNVLTIFRKLDFGSSVASTSRSSSQNDVRIDKDRKFDSLSLTGTTTSHTPENERKALKAHQRTSLPASITSLQPVRAIPASSAPKEKYRVISDVRPRNAMDLALRSGDIVEVIKKKDAMGSQDRWFVDMKRQQGFVRKDALEGPLVSSINTTPPPVPLRKDIQHKEESPTVHAAGKQEVPGNERCVAGYNFNPTGPYQLRLVAGQPANVLVQHDLDGNGEWYYVEDTLGARGYVPSSYLKFST